MMFSTDPDPVKSKPKCLVFSKKIDSGQVENVRLNGDSLPWVDTAKHLGNHLSSKINISCQAPESIDSTALYGSFLWLLASEEYMKLI